jgi:hypothetical protein
MRKQLLCSVAGLRPPSHFDAAPRPSAPALPPHADDDVLLTAKAAAAFVNLSLAAFWRNVCNRRLPPPVYPAPRAPRWRKRELHAACEARRMLPREAKEARRKAKLAHLKENSSAD